jgi:hypothetical protein
MPRTSRVTADDDREWRSAFLGNVVNDPRLRLRVSYHISVICGPDDPEVTPADVQAARGYLKKCVERMPTGELANKDWDDLAALWARGALGAARFRASGARPFRQESYRSRRADDEP